MTLFVCVADGLATPSVVLNAMMLPSPVFVPPMKLPRAAFKFTPCPVLPSAPPVAPAPMTLPSTRLFEEVAELICTPPPLLLPEMRLPAPVTAPPIKFEEAEELSSTPVPPLPLSTVPVTSVPR